MMCSQKSKAINNIHFARTVFLSRFQDQDVFTAEKQKSSILTEFVLKTRTNIWRVQRENKMSLPIFNVIVSPVNQDYFSDSTDRYLFLF